MYVSTRDRQQTATPWELELHMYVGLCRTELEPGDSSVSSTLLERNWQSVYWTVDSFSAFYAKPVNPSNYTIAHYISKTLKLCTIRSI